MLQKLTIQNIVLIERIALSFQQGLTVLTGETGAGKSILLDALGLILGKRAEARLVRAGEEKATVTAEFDISNRSGLLTWLEESGIEVETGESLLIRRQLKADGTSKAFVNDQPVTQKLLKDLGEQLVTIYGQHGQKGLLDDALHESLLDSYAGLQQQRAELEQSYRFWKDAAREQRRLEHSLEQAERERDYLEHMVKELKALAPEAGEEQALSEQRIALMQAEKQGKMLRDISASLNEGTPVASILARAQTMLMRSEQAEAPPITAAVDALERCLNELAEAESLIEAMLRDDGYDANALEKVEERLFALKDMARKHRTSADNLAELLQETEAKLTTLNHSTEALAAASRQVKERLAIYQAQAEALQQQRHAAIPCLCAAIHQELSPLKMEATRFRVTCEPLPQEQWGAGGMERITFEVSTNAGSPFAPLADIASGGELSRFMLAMAVVLGLKDDPAMLIFDEIDTGTGGAVAEAIGTRLARLAAHHQVAVVTHLPQVAAKGSAHYRIEKRSDGNQTTTQVYALSPQERHEELARMLSGAVITEEARKAALRLLATEAV